jgi:hypothetical protein
LIITISLAAGTPLGLQLAAVAQLPPFEGTHDLVTCPFAVEKKLIIRKMKITVKRLFLLGVTNGIGPEKRNESSK